jgi:hypothetical protein
MVSMYFVLRGSKGTVAELDTTTGINMVRKTNNVT